MVHIKVWSILMTLIHIFGRGIHTMKRNTEILIVEGKEFGLGGNTEDTKYMVMP
jgi:hypothetical protein